MTDESIRVGAIGAGDISGYHLAGLDAAGGARVQVISGRQADRVAATAERFGVPEYVTDYLEILDRDDIDAVVIATPERSHEPIATAAAAAGKAILLQKPVAESIEACERIIAVAGNAGVDLQVSFMHRFFEETVYARGLIRSGKLGAVFSARMRNATPGPDVSWYYDPETAAGGVVWCLGVHGIDLIQHLFGPIGEVHARCATMMPRRTLSDGTELTDIGIEDHALALYRTVDGVLVSHEMSICELKGTERFLLEIYAEKGTMQLRGPRGDLAIHAPEVTGVDDWVTPDLPDAAFGARQHAHWLDILRGRVRSDASALDALAGLHVVDAILAAAESGKTVSVPLVEGADYAR